jgi:hypothetical protein
MWTGAAGKCLTWSSHELGHYFFGLLFGLSTHLPDKNFFALYVNLDFSRVPKVCHANGDWEFGLSERERYPQKVYLRWSGSVPAYQLGKFAAD